MFHHKILNETETRSRSSTDILGFNKLDLEHSSYLISDYLQLFIKSNFITNFAFTTMFDIDLF